MPFPFTTPGVLVQSAAGPPCAHLMRQPACTGVRSCRACRGCPQSSAALTAHPAEEGGWQTGQRTQSQAAPGISAGYAHAGTALHRGTQPQPSILPPQAPPMGVNSLVSASQTRRASSTERSGDTSCCVPSCRNSTCGVVGQGGGGGGGGGGKDMPRGCLGCGRCAAKGGGGSGAEGGPGGGRVWAAACWRTLKAPPSSATTPPLPLMTAAARVRGVEGPRTRWLAPLGSPMGIGGPRGLATGLAPLS